MPNIPSVDACALAAELGRQIVTRIAGAMGRNVHVLLRPIALVACATLVACTERGEPAHAPPREETVTTDSLLIHRCGEAAQQNPCDVSLIELIARPELYHGKRVRVIGVANFEFEGNALYVHADDLENHVSNNGVWLAEPTYPVARLDTFSRRYALVEGTFSATDRGHLGMWSGAITNTTRLQSWGRLVPAKESSIP